MGYSDFLKMLNSYIYYWKYDWNSSETYRIVVCNDYLSWPTCLYRLNSAKIVFFFIEV